MIQSAVRGFLVRRRMLRLFAKVIMLQKASRYWRSKPKNFRKKKFAEMQRRKQNATIIQQQYQKHVEHQAIKEIRKQEMGATSQDATVEAQQSVAPAPSAPAPSAPAFPKEPTQFR